MGKGSSSFLALRPFPFRKGLCRTFMENRNNHPMIQKYSLCIITSFLLLSCSTNESIFKIGERVIAPVADATSASLHPTDSLSGAYMEAVWGIHAVRDSIAILNLYESKSCFRALNLTNLEYVDFLTVGRGPDEIIAGWFSRTRRVGDATLVDITAMNEDLILSIDLHETMRRGHTAVVERVKLPPRAANSFLLDDKILSEVTFDEDKYSIKVFDKEDLSTLRVEHLYGQDNYLAEFQPLFGSIMIMKPDATRLCMGMRFFDEINIFDINGDQHLNISTNKRSKSSAIIEDVIRTVRFPTHRFYVHMDVTDQRIYALYHHGESSGEWQSSTIHVFTWEGELVKVYHLDEVLIGLAVSEDGSTMYGLSDEEVLYKYVL